MELAFMLEFDAKLSKSDRFPCSNSVSNTFEIWLVVEPPTPLKNNYAFVSWDDMTFPTVSGKS